MPVFEVQLAEIRRLIAYVEAKTPAAAKREVRKTWSKLKDSTRLPFKVLIAKLYKPSLSARAVSENGSSTRRARISR